MPELPEVQTVVDDINRELKGLRIVSVWTDTPKQIRDVNAPSKRLTDRDFTEAEKNLARFVKDVEQCVIQRATRRGKNILIHLSKGKTMLIHLKMTGHLLIGKWAIVVGVVKPLEPAAIVSDPYNQYIHLVLGLSDARQLALSDVRKFAKVILGDSAKVEKLPDITNLGPDALSAELTKKAFSEHIKKAGPTIKQALLKPEVISGIGNIYSDDILYQAKIHPLRKPATLTNLELRRLYQSMRVVLAKAVSLRGTSTSDFRDTAGKEGGYTAHRLVYQRNNHPCQRCAVKIKRITVGGRSAHFCPQCQPLK